MGEESTKDAFDRGHTAGQIAAELKEHATHLNTINGSMEKVFEELNRLNLNVQGLRDDNKANAATVITTAKALKDAKDVERERNDQAWTPMARFIGIAGAVTAIIGIGVAVYANIKGG